MTALRMRTAALSALVAAVCVSGASGQKDLPVAGSDFVEIDAVVLDRKGQPMHGLRASDFTVKDEGKAMRIETFREVSGPMPDDPDSARTIVLLLDDTGVAAQGTQVIQNIARALVASASRIDDMPVVRLHARDDEPFGDRISGDARIAGFRGGAVPFAYWSTTKDVLARVSEIAAAVGNNASARKIVVCIGSSYICNIPEPTNSAPQSFESSWAVSLREAAKANLAVYALVPGSVPWRNGGLPDFTGGEVLTSSHDVGPLISRILSDASNYYLLGYWPTSTRSGLHRVEVKVKLRGAKVRARRAR